MASQKARGFPGSRPAKVQTQPELRLSENIHKGETKALSKEHK